MVFSGSHVGRSFSRSYRDLNENYHHYLQRVDCFFREIFLRNLVLPTWIYLFILNVDASRIFNICYFSELVLLLVVFLEFEQGEQIITMDNFADALGRVLGSSLTATLPVSPESNIVTDEKQMSRPATSPAMIFQGYSFVFKEQLLEEISACGFFIWQQNWMS